MDRLKNAAKATRDRVISHSRTANVSGSLSMPQASAVPDDGASTTSVSDGIIGPRPGVGIQDFATSEPIQKIQSPVDVHKPLPHIPAGIDAAVHKAVEGPHASTSQDPTTLTAPDRGSNIPKLRQKNPLHARRPHFGSRQPSIGIRRMPSARTNCLVNTEGVDSGYGNGTAFSLRLPEAALHLPTLPEETQDAGSASSLDTRTEGQQRSRWEMARVGIRSIFSRHKGLVEENGSAALGDPSDDYDASMVDVLDTIDPEVAALTSLTNVQNSLFIPNLGRWVNRRPTYILRNRASEMTEMGQFDAEIASKEPAEQEDEVPTLRRAQTDTQTVATIDSTLSDSRYAVLPHGASVSHWSKADKKELNDHVRHMLHSKRSRFKRTMKGFGQYVRRPLGFAVTLYATLITLFGLAWVLFLIGWINVGGKQLYIINVIDNIMVALFAVVGDGLAPFRAVDTYHMIFIAHYHFLTWKRRSHEMLPELHDHNDLPASNAPIKQSEEYDVEKQWEFTMLSPTQQAKLEHHQTIFSSSHSFYKPHETETHYAFPLKLLVAVVVLLDCHSIFQIALGTCTWAIYYKRRPFALTTVILCCSISCNAIAGVLILVGDRRTRKNDVLERMNRQELTEEAMGKMEEKREREKDRERNEERSWSGMLPRETRGLDAEY